MFNKFLVLFLSCAVWMGAQAQAAMPTSQVVAGVSEPVKAWTKAVESGNTAALKRMYTDKTDVYSTDATVTHGMENIVAGYARMFEKFTSQVQIKDASYIKQGNTVVSWGLYSLTLTPRAGGASFVVNGRFTDVAVKTNGQWVYLMDHASLPTK